LALLEEKKNVLRAMGLTEELHREYCTCLAAHNRLGLELKIKELKIRPHKSKEEMEVMKELALQLKHLKEELGEAAQLVVTVESCKIAFESLRTTLNEKLAVLSESFEVEDMEASENLQSTIISLQSSFDEVNALIISTSSSSNTEAPSSSKPDTNQQNQVSELNIFLRDTCKFSVPASTKYSEVLVLSHCIYSVDSLTHLKETGSLTERLLSIGMKDYDIKSIENNLPTIVANQNGSIAVADVISHGDPAQSSYSIPEMNLQELTQITTSPRTIMKQLFAIQGLELDPDNLKMAVAEISKVVGSGFGDGIDKYDCFLNYRVNADKDIAEKLFYMLKAAGIYAFFDKECLKKGEEWKEGFLAGLKNSRSFVALISRNCLSSVRDSKRDHSYDNVLLEYETALKIKASTGCRIL
jgi:hypothetical protein